MEYYALFNALAESGVECLVTGGLALNLHGLPHLTFDVDLLPEPSAANFERLLGCLARLGFAPRGGVKPADFVDPGERRKRCETAAEPVLRFGGGDGPLREIDVALAGPAPWDELRRRGVRFRFHGAAATVMALEDLKTLKGFTARPSDRIDLEGLGMLDLIRTGRGEELPPGPRRKQIESFQSWPLEKRIDWLQTSSLLAQQGGEARTGGGRRGLKRTRKIPGLNHPDLS